MNAGQSKKAERAKNKGWKGRAHQGRPDEARRLAQEHVKEVLGQRSRAHLTTAPGLREPVTRSDVRHPADKAERFRGPETQHGGE